MCIAAAHRKPRRFPLPLPASATSDKASRVQGLSQLRITESHAAVAAYAAPPDQKIRRVHLLQNHEHPRGITVLFYEFNCCSALKAHFHCA